MKTLVDKKNDKDIADCGLDDDAIKQVMKDITEGRIDADLGGGLIKQRIARGTRGKSKGCRGLIVSQSNDTLILVHIFPKGSKANISAKEKKTLLKLSRYYRGLSPDEIRSVAKAEKWRTIEYDPQG